MSATAKMRHYHSARPMLTMAMGRAGVLTRITGEGFGSDMTFASVGGKASAPGQIPAEDADPGSVGHVPFVVEPAACRMKGQQRPVVGFRAH